MKYLTILLILLSVKSYGQKYNEKPKRTVVEEALLDSAAKYENIKVALVHLQVAYGYQGKEIEDLREALRLRDLQSAVQKQNFEQQIADLRKKTKGQWWKGFKAGLGTGTVIGAVAGSSIN